MVKPDYPHPASPAVTKVMRGNKRRDTKPEVRIRSLLHRSGLRFRKDHRVRPAEGRPVRVDIAFTARRLAVFIDGCFWHSCPEHGKRPKRNTAYWHPKLTRNMERDAENTAALTRAGWTVLRIWEHVAPEDAAEQVRAALEALL
jgi:DNA mismatch endonuclease (patch repair protein)